MNNSIENLITQGESMQSEVYQQREWIERAIPYLKSELWRISDCLAMPTESGLGADLDAAMDEELDRKHKELTELLKLVEKESFDTRNICEPEMDPVEFQARTNSILRNKESK